MKIFKKTLIPLCASVMLLAIPTFAINIQTTEIKSNTETNLDSKDYSTSLYEVSHTYSNFVLSSGTSLNTNISLSSSQPYGKAHYYNSSAYPATMTVSGVETITIAPYSSGYIIWKKSSTKKTYNVTVTATSGTLSGKFSLAKADAEDQFQK